MSLLVALSAISGCEDESDSATVDCTPVENAAVHNEFLDPRPLLAVSPIPGTMDEASTALQATLTARQRLIFACFASDEIAGATHMSLGLTIRNGWRLWESASPLSADAAAQGFDHPDDISWELVARQAGDSR